MRNITVLKILVKIRPDLQKYTGKRMSVVDNVKYFLAVFRVTYIQKSEVLNSVDVPL